MTAAASHQPDAGFATVWVAAVMAALLAVGLLQVQWGAASIARHRAEAAADLAALAAAGHAADGETAACAYAARVTRAMAAGLSGCRVAAWEARVETEVEPTGVLGSWGTARARARAGPEDG